MTANIVWVVRADIARLELAIRAMSGLVQSENFRSWAIRWADGKDRSESRIDSAARAIHQIREAARMESRAGTPVYDAALACLRAASHVAALVDYERDAASFASRGQYGMQAGVPALQDEVHRSIADACAQVRAILE